MVAFPKRFPSLVIDSIPAINEIMLHFNENFLINGVVKKPAWGGFVGYYQKLVWVSFNQGFSFQIVVGAGLSYFITLAPT